MWRRLYGPSWQHYRFLGASGITGSARDGVLVGCRQSGFTPCPLDSGRFAPGQGVGEPFSRQGCWRCLLWFGRERVMCVCIRLNHE